MSGERKLTATQVWSHLTLVQRESVLSWFVSSYSPTGAHARPLARTPVLTHASKIIAEKWAGASS